MFVVVNMSTHEQPMPYLSEATTKNLAALDARGGSTIGFNLAESSGETTLVGLLDIHSSSVGGLKKEEPKDLTGTP